MIGANHYYNAPGTERLDAVCVPSFNNPVENKWKRVYKRQKSKASDSFSPTCKSQERFAIRGVLRFHVCQLTAVEMSLDKVGQLRLW